MARGNAKGRAGPKRARRPVIYIFCEGTETEKIYLNHYKSRNNGIDLRVLSTQHKAAPYLVEEARQTLKREDYYPGDGDLVWCVFDRNGNTEAELTNAQQKADKYCFRIAFSNPAFEIWFLLHFIDQHAPLNDSQAIIRKFAKIPALRNYEKAKDYYAAIYSHRAVAIQRAECLIQEHKNLGREIIHKDSNPCTTIVDLIEYLISIQ